MNEALAPIKRVLISVSDKTYLVEFANALVQLDIEIISTGGTAKLLRENNIPVKDVADITQFPEMMDGRIKTLHPKIHGGILGLRDVHAAVAKQHDIPWIDLVVVNLYPFAKTIQKPSVSFDEAIENIDIGGPTMIRAAAKNMGWVGVVVDPEDYQNVIEELKKENGLTFQTRKKLAIKAFAHTADYDTVIKNYFINKQSGKSGSDPKCGSDPDCREKTGSDPISQSQLTLKNPKNLRYGENPHQSATAYQLEHETGILSAKQHQGKELSYNNITDADAALSCVNEFSEPACVIVKHANPCGAAIAEDIIQAFDKALAADKQSAFGGIVALNRECTEELAEKLAQIFFEVIIAPSYSKQALTVFSKKNNLRILELDSKKISSQKSIKHVTGGLLIQDQDDRIITENDLTIVTDVKPSALDIKNVLFAWHVVKHIKSNAILIAKNNVTLGIGAGQVSRIDAVDIALRKAADQTADAVLASDAFFPFRDSIDRLKNTGIRAIIQPGGSIKDSDVIAACNELKIAMVFTGVRCFKH